ncbi:MAG: NFYB/HAP3 family transcription factor subunit [Nanoarchaeota archaeon]|nr:NFYB/HAP3 family transcription factor subunit [Nanoarchaeota archaeon]
MLPKASIERIAKKAGAERISADAVKELQITIEEIGLELAIEVAHAAKYAKRKTIKASDVRFIAHK